MTIYNWLSSNVLLIFGVILLFPPFVVSTYWTHVLILCGVFAVLASSFDLLAGYTGQFALTTAMFFGVGAYSSALAALKFGISPWFGLILGGIVAAILGLATGTLCLRVHGAYLSMVTLGVAQILLMIVISWVDLTGGSAGLRDIPSFSGFPYSRLNYYYLMLCILFSSLFVIRRIADSWIGIIFRTIREDPQASEAIGIDTIRYRLLAFTLSAFFCGVIGSFYAHYTGLLCPSDMGFSQLVNIITIAILGGLGSILGPALASFILTIVSENLRILGYPEIRLVMFGLIIVVVVILVPRGIASIMHALRPKT